MCQAKLIVEWKDFHNTTLQIGDTVLIAKSTYNGAPFLEEGVIEGEFISNKDGSRRKEPLLTIASGDFKHNMQLYTVSRTVYLIKRGE